MDTTKEEFYSRLSTSKSRFKYLKKNGEVRKAYGTLIPSEVPALSPMTEGRRKLPEGSLLYYDLDKSGYRSFKTENFMGFQDWQWKTSSGPKGRILNYLRSKQRKSRHDPSLGSADKEGPNAFKLL